MNGMWNQFIFLIILCACDAYKILVVFPIPGKSHGILGEGYVEKLLEAGHEVTYITPVPIKTSLPRLKQIDISENFQYLSQDMFDVQKLMRDELKMQDHIELTKILNTFLYNTLKLDAVQKFIHNTKEEFDLVIVEWLNSELGAGFSTVFNCPLIWSASTAINSFSVALIDEHLNPSYSGHFLSRDHSLTFWNRVHDLYTITKTRFVDWLNREKYNVEFKSIFGPAIAKRGRQVPHFEDVKYNASLMLANSDAVMSLNVAVPENYKHIGGYHLKETVDPLPENIKKIMDEAKEGVIYFSLGSMVRGNRIPEIMKRQLLDMFSELKHTVIWKLDQKLENLPKNVHLVTWAPQRSILDHPNCLLFVTHGGLLSAYETIHHGVPVIGIPFFGDQFLNVDIAVKEGFGKRVDFKEDVAVKLKSAIQEMLENPSYRERVKELSIVFKDRLVPPGKELVYWVEHVIKTRGAPHLRSAAMKLSWYTKLYLDFVAVLLFIFVTLFLVVKKLFGYQKHLKLD